MPGEAMRETASILPLSIERLRYEADGHCLLEDITLCLPRGGLSVILGPNGAGKTLLLRLCHGLLEPTAGRVNWSLEGGRRAGAKGHAMVFQKPVILRRSARANIEHALAAAGVPARVRQERAMAALRRFDLEALANRPARVLSGGEQQRLAIARAWALDAEVLFLDEPTSQLDPAATRAIEAMLHAMKDEGRTLVMTTHDMGQARRLASRVLFMAGARLIEDAPAERFFTQPETPQARRFLAGELVV